MSLDRSSVVACVGLGVVILMTNGVKKSRQPYRTRTPDRTACVPSLDATSFTERKLSANDAGATSNYNNLV